MKPLKLLALAVICVLNVPTFAQTVDEIITGYIENTGGLDAWSNLKGIRITASVNQQGMEIPLEIVQLADGKQYTKITFQGLEIFQGVFDGSTMWSTNFQTMKAEKSDDETTSNAKLDANDFPESFLNYKEKGYTAELMGTETVEGTEAFKIRLTKEPRTIDGEQVDDISYYYFDSEAFVPIMQEMEVRQGPMKGSIQQVTFSDYQEVEGLYFPFSLTQGIKGGESAPLKVEGVEINPTIDDKVFAFPVEGNE